MQAVKNLGFFAFLSLFLTACGSNPQSYITGKKQPIVNVEAQAEPFISVKAKSDSLEFRNKTNGQVTGAYQLFWYDNNGVTQSLNPNQDGSGWQTFYLPAQTAQKVALNKPTPESENYRVYVKMR